MRRVEVVRARAAEPADAIFLNDPRRFADNLAIRGLPCSSTFSTSRENIRRSPASSGAAILTLTLTRGAGASIFAVVDAAIVLTPPPFTNPDNLPGRTMGPQARTIWDSLEFRTPAILRATESLSEAELRWQPPNAGNSIAWLLWHIPEVEDNWVRDKLLNLPKRYPFGVSVKAHSHGEWPSKNALLSYFREVRALTKDRLEQTREEEFDRMIADEHFGSITVRQAWGGVLTSCAWHGGQIIFIVNRLLAKAGASVTSS